MSKKLLILWLFLLVQFSLGQSEDSNKECLEHDEIRYLTFQNTVSKSNDDPKVREIYLFYDERAFSEENLRILFTYLSKKYPKPNSMTIRLETSWDKVSDPDCGEGVGYSNRPDLEKKRLHAVFIRSGKNEFFRFTPTLESINLETVVIKGTAF
jgi:hypothetical protein